LRAGCADGLLGSHQSTKELIMNHPLPKPDPGAKGRPILEEADIGSGEKTPAQIETEELIRQIPPLPPSGRPADTGVPPSQPGGEQASPGR
jgi:hypothetical protein